MAGALHPEINHREDIIERKVMKHNGCTFVAGKKKKNELWCKE